MRKQQLRDTMDLTATRLEEVLGDRPHCFYPQVESTNDIALAWAAEGAPPGAVVVADAQTRGRGRLGRMWYAPPGTALMCSTILRPPPEHTAQVNMLGALAVCEAVEALGGLVSLKWPNDVLLDGRKLAGILTEAAWHDNQLAAVALGIGINIRVDFAGTPYADTAISLEPTLGRKLDRAELLAGLLERLETWAGHWGNTLLAAWRGRLATLGQMVQVGNVRGVAEAVDARGALLVRGDDGVLHTVVAGDVVMGAGDGH
jgi:BirA family biotin operon repressor/biotin-[acetyl-CoA-carboxylase] ligase